jgi:hypothetical protein
MSKTDGVYAAQAKSKPALLPGPTAFSYYRKSNRYTLALIIDFAAIFVSTQLSGLQNPLYISLAGVATVLAFVILIPFARNAIRLKKAVRREFAAGYSTLRTRKRGIWLLDPNTGEVLRNPNKT